ncbi:hypothetical protein P7K49_023012 [Saguinus oedipus]|uniref:Uncharacterized protein n=1 Tax=Saguinus oedipus TaxID=9490 RepID=A0ABQ9UKF2_SAGOE|nr:hypothetical protein P7K49_023012 [Saguinus oedipus]
MPERENEVLKVQLKKYVGAVQMLKREGQTAEGNFMSRVLRQLRGSEPCGMMKSQQTEFKQQKSKMVDNESSGLRLITFQSQL